MNLKRIWSGFKAIMHTMAFVYFVATVAILAYTAYVQPEILELTIAMPMHIVIVLILFAVLQNAIAGCTVIRKTLRRWTKP